MCTAYPQYSRQRGDGVGNECMKVEVVGRGRVMCVQHTPPPPLSP